MGRPYPGEVISGDDAAFVQSDSTFVAAVSDGLTIVVSPLISLMEDQVNQLRDEGIPACVINSALSPGMRREAMNQVAELRQRLEAMQAAPATAAAPVPPPLTPFEAFEQTLPPAAAGPTPPVRS